jgi:hypothetical protein
MRLSFFVLTADQHAGHARSGRGSFQRRPQQPLSLIRILMNSNRLQLTLLQEASLFRKNKPVFLQPDIMPA